MLPTSALAGRVGGLIFNTEDKNVDQQAHWLLDQYMRYKRDRLRSKGPEDYRSRL